MGPWVFLDHFGPFRVTPGQDGVGPHPHAGIETVTYLLSGRSSIATPPATPASCNAGGAQWMTAGRGIIHAETPLAEHGGRAHDARHPAVDHAAARAEADRAALPAPRGAERFRRRAGRRARCAWSAASSPATPGPGQALMPLVLAHVDARARRACSRRTSPAGFEMAAYVIAGEGSFGDDGEARAAPASSRSSASDGEGHRLSNAATGAARGACCSAARPPRARSCSTVPS